MAARTTITEFTEEELELARKAQRDYYRRNREKRKAYNTRYWIRKALKQEETTNAKAQTVTE